jgi:hypothetical protein
VVAANTGYAEVPAIVATNAALSVVLVPVKATQTANFDISTTLVGVTNVQLSGSTVKFGLAYPVA